MDNSEKSILHFTSEIESLIDKSLPDEQVNVTEIKKLFNIIKDTSLKSDFTQVYQLSKAILDLIIGYEYQKKPITRKVFDLIRVLNVYINEYFDNKAESKTLFIKNITGVIAKISSGVDADIDTAFIKDILQKKGENIEDLLKYRTDPKKEIPIKIKSIDDVITRINELILTQYQLKNEVEKIYEFEKRFMKIINDKKNPESELKRIKTIENDIKKYMLKFDRLSFSLQENVLSLRMVPIALLFEKIQVVCEELCVKYGKLLKISVIHNNILIDRMILEYLKVPFMNILTNAIEHGVERLDERIKKGKNKEGLIKIFVAEKNDKINIMIDDDGRGIDYEKILLSVTKSFPHKKRELEKSKSESLNRFLFVDGITSSDEVNKGFGLSEVARSMAAVKGKVIFRDKGDNGVRFILSTSKSLTTIYGYFVKSGGEKFFVPSLYISEILIIGRDEVMDLVSKQAIQLRNNIVPIYPLTGVLHGKNPSNSEKLFIIIIELYNEITGIIVDEVLYHSSAIYKPLPKNIENIQGIQGVVFDEDFKIVNIIYVPVIVKMVRNIKNIDYKTRYSENTIYYKSVIVADDSEINRDIMVTMLKRNSINVDVAADGIEALEKIKRNNYDLIITDTDMPRMDGMTLVENIKKISEYENIPIILLTSSDNGGSIGSYEDSGISKVHSKSHFDRDSFLEDIRELLGIKNG